MGTRCGSASAEKGHQPGQRTYQEDGGGVYAPAKPAPASQTTAHCYAPRATWVVTLQGSSHAAHQPWNTGGWRQFLKIGETSEITWGGGTWTSVTQLWARVRLPGHGLADIGNKSAGASRLYTPPRSGGFISDTQSTVPIPNSARALQAPPCRFRLCAQEHTGGPFARSPPQCRR